MAEDQALTDAQINQRFGSIETEQQKQGGMIQRVLDALQAGARPPAAPAAAGAPADIGAAVRDELARAGKAQEDQETRTTAQAAKAAADALAAQVEALKEAPPAEPVRRVEGLMGWRRG
jgi:hypothetical protein